MDELPRSVAVLANSWRDIVRALDLGRESIDEDVQAQPRASSVGAGLFECLDRQVKHCDKPARAKGGRKVAGR